MSNDNDFVDEVVSESPPVPTPAPLGPNLTDTPDSVKKMLNEGVGPLAATESTDDKEVKVEVKRLRTKAEQFDLQVKIRRQLRLEEIKQDTKVLSRAADFLRDLAGAERFTAEYSPYPWVRCSFRIMDTKTLDEMTTQNVRDLLTGDAAYTEEHKYIHRYVFAGTLLRFSMSDPQSGAVIKVYDYDASTPEVMAHPHQPGATLLRRRHDYLIDKIFTASSIYSAALAHFSNFQQLVSDLSFLSAEDPDFFQKCLTGESYQAADSVALSPDLSTAGV